MQSGDAYGQAITWNPQAPRYRVLHLLLSWLVAGVAVFVAAAIVPHVSVGGFGDALVAAALIAVFNAVLPPLVMHDLLLSWRHRLQGTPSPGSPADVLLTK